MRLGILILAMVLPAIAIAKPDKSDKPKKAAKADTVFVEKADKEKNETEVKVEGVLEVGVDINNKMHKDKTNYNKIGYGKIELSARPVKKVRAEFGFEYKDGDSTLVIDKLLGQYNFTDFGSIRVGYMKKAFGLEEKAGVAERYFHKRSVINDNLENFHHLGHDLTMQYRHKLSESWRLIGGFSWAADTVRELYHQNYSIEYETPSTTLILAGIIGHFTHSDYDLTAWATSLSFKYTAKLFVSETEFTFGNNPIIKYMDDKDVLILGARMQEYFPIETGFKGLRQVIPIAEASIYMGDLDSQDFEAQLRAGFTLGFAKNSAFQWRNTYGTRLKVVDGDSKQTHRRYDSEVVVIF
ncbi:MAG: hypothetical protein FWC26_10660 [Fibromonadales bacterium]|nr:hypothetical protein [Fibromonadales bacterium]